MDKHWTWKHQYKLFAAIIPLADAIVIILTSYTAPSTVMLTFIAVFNASQDGMNLPLVFLQVLLSG